MSDRESFQPHPSRNLDRGGLISPSERETTEPRRRKGRALSVSKPWRPSRNQLAALRVAIENPGIRGARSIARVCGLHFKTVMQWRRRAEFVEWWEKSLLSYVRKQSGVVLAELLRIVQDPEVPEGAKIKAGQVYLSHVAPVADPMQGALAALTAAFGPASEIAFAARDGATGNEISAKLSKKSSARDLDEMGIESGAIDAAFEGAAKNGAEKAVAEMRQVEVEGKERAEGGRVGVPKILTLDHLGTQAVPTVYPNRIERIDL